MIIDRCSVQTLKDPLLGTSLSVVIDQAASVEPLAWSLSLNLGLRPATRLRRPA